jgi:hypothetical protein
MHRFEMHAHLLETEGGPMLISAGEARNVSAKVETPQNHGNLRIRQSTRLWRETKYGWAESGGRKSYMLQIV